MRKLPLLLLSPLLALLPALELIAAGPPHDSDSDPVIHRVHNAFSAVKNISKRDVECPPGKHGDNCCDLCEPGHVKDKDCTTSSKTICKPCTEGEEYMDHYNYLTKCHRCSSCDSEHGLEVDKPCNRSQNVKCRCKHGFFCSSLEQCHHCNPCTKCEDGTVVEECTPTRDATCRKKQNLLWLIVIIPLVSIGIASIIWYKKYKSKMKQPKVEQRTEEMDRLNHSEKYPDIDLMPYISEIAEDMTLKHVLKFVRKQGLSSPTIEKIDLENTHDASEKKIKLLQTWYEEKGTKGAYETLICCLKDLKLRRLADKIVQKMTPHIENSASVCQNMNAAV